MNTSAATKGGALILALDPATGQTRASALDAGVIGTLPQTELTNASAVWIKDNTGYTVYDARTATRLFTYPLPNEQLLTSNLTYAPNNVVLLSYGYLTQQCPVMKSMHVQAFDASTGRVLWSRTETLPYNA